MPLRAETRQDNSAGGPKRLAAGVGAAAEQQRQWWWQHTTPTNKHLKPVRVIRSPVPWATASKAAKRWFNYSWRSRGTCSYCTFMCVQCWQQIKPRPAKMQTRSLKYISMNWKNEKKLNQQEYTYRTWCWHWMQQRQQRHRKEIENKQDSRIMLSALGPSEVKWSEGVWEGMLLIWKKKEAKQQRSQKSLIQRA